MAKKKAKTILITQKTTDEVVLSALQNEDARFILSDSVDTEFRLITAAKEYFKTTSSVAKTIELLVQKQGLTVHNAKKIFDKMGTLYSTIDRAKYRELLVDKLFDNINQTRNFALVDGDHAAMAKCDANLQSAISEFLGTSDAIDQSQLRLPDVIAAFHPDWFPDVPAIGTAEYQVVIAQFKQRKDKKKRQEAEDIDFEEV